MKSVFFILVFILISLTAALAQAESTITCSINGIKYSVPINSGLARPQGVRFAKGLIPNLEFNLYLSPEENNIYQFEIISNDYQDFIVVTLAGELGEKGFFYSGTPTGANENVTLSCRI